MKYALKNKYPIETEGQVKTAVEYFDRYLQRFDPVERIAIATNIEKRANELNIDVDSPWVTNYSRVFKKQASYSPDFERNMKARVDFCKGRHVKIASGNGEDIINSLMAKKNEIEPVVMMQAVSEFDKQAGITVGYDHSVADPVVTVFGSLNNPEYDSEKIAGDLTNYDAIRILRDNKAMSKFASAFAKHIVDSFKNDPVGTIKKMSEPEKELLESIAK